MSTCAPYITVLLHAACVWLFQVFFMHEVTSNTTGADKKIEKLQFFPIVKFKQTVSDRSRRGSPSHLHICLINCQIWGEVPAWCVLVSGIFRCSIAPGEVWGAAVAAVPSVRPASGCTPGPGHTALGPVWTEIVQTDWTCACKHTNKTCTIKIDTSMAAEYLMQYC